MIGDEIPDDLSRRAEEEALRSFDRAEQRRQIANASVTPNYEPSVQTSESVSERAFIRDNELGSNPSSAGTSVAPPDGGPGGGGVPPTWTTHTYYVIISGVLKQQNFVVDGAPF